ncbi:MAG: biopolymer transporter ExbD [Campylobacterales bacterium]|nr:biopolymer transporter ExbD [Campylobacterales bacterium]
MSAKTADLELGEIAEINMTPFVDIVLVLLVIFMATATLITQNKIAVNLPSSVTSDKQPDEKEKITITINEKAEIFVDDKPSSKEALQNALIGKKIAILRADAKANFESVISVLDECKKAGISKYQVDTNRK